MRLLNKLVFDQTVVSGTSYQTKAHHNDLLGSRDSLAINVIADNNANLRGTVTVAIEHSNDGVSWMQKNTTPEINAVTIGNQTDVLYGSDNGFAPNLRFARLRISAGGTTTVHLAVYVTLRDASKPDNVLAMLMRRVLRHVGPSVARDVAALIYALRRVRPETLDDLKRLLDDSWQRGASRTARLGHVHENMTGATKKELLPVIALLGRLGPHLMPYAGELWHLSDSEPELDDAPRYPHIDRLLRHVKPEAAAKYVADARRLLVSYFVVEGAFPNDPHRANPAAQV